MTQQIQTTFSQPVEFIPQARSTPASNTSSQVETETFSRAGRRRMRTETTTTCTWSWGSEPTTTDLTGYGPKHIELIRLEKALMSAFKKGNYSEALAHLANIETISENFLQRAEFVIENLVKGQFNETRAYFQALMKNPEALALCDSGFEQLSAALDTALEIAREMGMEEWVTKNAQEVLKKEHLFYRGFLALSMGEREQAIQDLQNSVGPLLFDQGLTQSWSMYNRSDRMEMSFFLRILEQKLGTPLMPVAEQIDPMDPESLFLAGQYKEALQVIESRKTVETDVQFGRDWYERREQRSADFVLKGACLALIGQTQEAIRWFEQASSDYYDDFDIMTSLIHFLSGDLKAAKDSLMKDKSSDEFFIPFPIVASFGDKLDFMRHMIPLAIQGFEQTVS